MNLKQLPYIVAIAETGNLSSASVRLGVSQPALSKYLQELERETGIPLFFRNKKQYIPTPAGKLYLQTARRILELQRHTASSILPMKADQEGELRLGVSPNRGIEVLARAYPSLDLRYPRVKLTVKEGYAAQFMEMLLRGEVDTVITSYYRELPEELRRLHLFTEELVMAAPASHFPLDQTGMTVSELPFADLKDFKDEIFVMPAGASGLNALIQEYFRTEDFKPTITTYCPNMVIVDAMIRSGNRVGFLPGYYVKTGGDTVFFRLRRPIRMTVSIITGANRPFSEVERYLIYLLVKDSLRHSESVIWSQELEDIMHEFEPTVSDWKKRGAQG